MQTGPNSQRLALLGGDPIFTTPPTPTYPVFSQTARQRVDQLLEDGPMLGLSKATREIEEVEDALAHYFNVPKALGTNSGHAALHASLIGLEIGEGDEVVTSPYSWGASVSCILHTGAVPVFADVNADTGLLDPKSVAERISGRTRAILVPHIFGQPADMTLLCGFAAERGVAIVEDGSQAHGAEHDGRRVGSFGQASGFSCNGVKPVATSEAGFMLCRDEDIYWKACISCQHAGATDFPGRASEPGFPEHLRPYVDSLIYSYRLSTINAILMAEQLGKLDDDNAGRRANYRTFVSALRGLTSVSVPEYPPEDVCAVHMATLNYDEASTGVDKSAYVAALEAEGVPAFSYVRVPLHRLERLRPDTAAPRVTWTRALQRAGQDPTKEDLPGCEAKVRRSIELYWNYIAPADGLMKRMASAFEKVEQELDTLRTWARDRQPLGTPAAALR
jgi:dTDP-4-amino-4,6-dideoxygalactose transaminase